MTLKIDFYLAKAPTFQQCHDLCYTLTTHAYNNFHDISILFNTLDMTQQFSQALWQQHSDRFIPHTVDQNKNILVVARPSNNQPMTQCNMQTLHNNLLSNSNHLIQIVPNNETNKQQARALYKHITALGHHITVHKDA